MTQEPEVTPEVTVVIPSHNRRRLMARTLHAVLAQRDVALEVLVVDDGSRDDTTAWLSAHPDPRVHAHRHPEPRGVSAARNTGLASARGRWVAFTDDDDLWAPDKLRLQLDALADDPGTRWSCVGAVNVDLGARPHLWHLPLESRDLGVTLLRINCVPGGGSGVLVDRALAVELGGFDEAISNLADWDFYIRLGLAAPVAPVHRLLVGYLVDAGGMAHGIGRSEREYRYLDVKHERDRRARGVELDRVNWLSYLGGLAYHSGQRATATRLHGTLAARHGQSRSVRTAVGSWLPLSVKRARQAAWLTRSPLPEPCEWLEPYQSGWLDDPRGD
ncbi:glycosyltransferase involved in cell wall biosynthesis [Friedmanniella endophytica]|uniref:Glycosyltransferase involved in cell wall biosynthesis n=1 Tax=Microlunatus kandeliicorticis TaxID=1759536 RepID=A0A7W3P5T7_9ACTN|nr:glycosyltransferase family A protein [Microlunatus kandeliicorticis]MBA8794248.1 glycosyltransferase involved in cell wall biosynthesis [Microlunatus kandeliicorticis]